MVRVICSVVDTELMRFFISRRLAMGLGSPYAFPSPAAAPSWARAAMNWFL